QLVALGLARVDHEAHGALRLTAASRAVLRGEQRIELRRAVERVRPREKKKPPPVLALNGEEESLLARLKSWRTEESRTQSIPAYVIFHDTTLAELARVKPRTLQALAGVSGIGAKKLERYGDALLALLGQADAR